MEERVDETVSEPPLYSWKNRWMRTSVLSLVAMTVASLLIGFVWLPSEHGDFSAEGIWASICRAAGVPKRWGPVDQVAAASRTTAVVLNRSMAEHGSDQAVGLGATVALQCTICHGVRGLTSSDAPNLAGQYPEVIIKQLDDYRRGDRVNSVMRAYAQGLTPTQVHDVAAYYAYLPRAVNPALEGGTAAPKLVQVGDAMRNIASCASCHGGRANKLGAPWLEAMPKEYLLAQLTAFATGARHNDSHGQMRNMARRLTSAETEDLATFYARRPTE